jgi:hypothetical protein
MLDTGCWMLDLSRRSAWREAGFPAHPQPDARCKIQGFRTGTVMNRHERVAAPAVGFLITNS